MLRSNNYAAARLQGLERDLHLTGDQYQVGLSILFVAYVSCPAACINFMTYASWDKLSAPFHKQRQSLCALRARCSVYLFSHFVKQKQALLQNQPPEFYLNADVPFHFSTGLDASPLQLASQLQRSPLMASRFLRCCVGPGVRVDQPSQHIWTDCRVSVPSRSCW